MKALEPPRVAEVNVRLRYMDAEPPSHLCILLLKRRDFISFDVEYTVVGGRGTFWSTRRYAVAHATNALLFQPEDMTSLYSLGN